MSQRLQINDSPQGTRDDPLVDLCDMRFDNSFVRELPADPVLTNVPRQVRGASYTRVDPTPRRRPRGPG